ncbi:MAG: class I SAM-dependent methyltransferase [Pseudomonadota bacterium]
MAFDITVPRRPHALCAAYDQAAQSWQDTVSRLGYPAAYQEMFDTLPPRCDGPAIDVGCGPGTFARALLAAAPGVPQLDLLDPSAPMLEAAARAMGRSGPTQLRFTQAGIGTDLIRGGYQSVLCAHVIEHLDDPLDALGWLRSLLAPGGQLYLVVSRPHWCTVLLRWKWGHRAYRTGEMAKMLTVAGFATCRTVTFSAGPPSRTSAGYIAR